MTATAQSLPYRLLPYLGGAAAWLLAAAALGANGPEFGGFAAFGIYALDAPAAARELDPVDLSFVIDPDLVDEILSQPPFAAEAACVFFAENQGRGQRGITVDFSGTVVTPDGAEPIPRVRRRTDRNGYASVVFTLEVTGPPGDDVGFNVRIDPGGGRRADTWGGDCRAGAWKLCQPTASSLCLNDGRFRVEVEWQDFAGAGGPGTAQLGDDDSGFFFFGDEQLSVDVLKRCPVNNHFWVFAAATTNVEFELTVTDTQTGVAKVYDNPLGTPFQPIQDLQAFATCP